MIATVPALEETTTAVPAEVSGDAPLTIRNIDGCTRSIAAQDESDIICKQAWAADSSWMFCESDDVSELVRWVVLDVNGEFVTS